MTDPADRFLEEKLHALARGVSVPLVPTEDDVRRLIGRFVRSYLAQVDEYRKSEDDDFALHLDNTSGPIHAASPTGTTS